MDLDGAAGDSCDGGVCHHWRRDRDATLELAAAAAVRLAPDYHLAGAWTAASLPDSVWRVGRVQGGGRGEGWAGYRVEEVMNGVRNGGGQGEVRFATGLGNALYNE